MLTYAMTVHKSPGLTLAKVVLNSEDKDCIWPKLRCIVAS